MDFSLIIKAAKFAYKIYQIEQKYGVIDKVLPVVFDAIKAITRTEVDTKLKETTAQEKHTYARNILDSSENTEVKGYKNTGGLINFIHEVACGDPASIVNTSKANTENNYQDLKEDI